MNRGMLTCAYSQTSDGQDGMSMERDSAECEYRKRRRHGADDTKMIQSCNKMDTAADI